MVAPGGQQFEGLWFSDSGWVAQGMYAPTDKGFVIQVYVTLTNRSHFSVTIHDEFEGEAAFTSTWKNILGGGNYVPENPPSRLKKIGEASRQALRELADREGFSKEYMGISGRWDVISDNVLGQVQGEYRLVREFPAPVA